MPRKPTPKSAKAAKAATATVKPATGPQMAVGQGIPWGDYNPSQPFTENGGTPLIPYDMNGFFINSGTRLIKPFDIAPPGSYEVYEKVANYPTMVLGLSKRVNPLIRTPWVWGKRNDSVLDAWLNEAKSVFDPHRWELLRQSKKAMVDGWEPNEVVWDFGAKSIGVEEFKPLSVRNTEFIIDVKTGRKMGLRNVDANGKMVDLPLGKTFAYSFDPQPGDPYSRSHPCEKIRPRWGEVNQIISRAAMYTSKISNVVPMIHYPAGMQRMPGGAQWPNWYMANYLLTKLGNGEGITVPNEFNAMAATGKDIPTTTSLMEKALASAGKSSWNFQFLEPGGVNYLDGFVAFLAYYDVLFVRACEIPEKSILTTSHGDRGQSKVHDNSADAVSEVDYGNFCRQFLVQVVDPWLVMRYGPAAKGALTLEAPQLSKTNNDDINAVIKALLASTNPAVADAAAAATNMPMLLDEAQIPKTKDSPEIWDTLRKNLQTSYNGQDKQAQMAADQQAATARQKPATKAKKTKPKDD